MIFSFVNQQDVLFLLKYISEKKTDIKVLIIYLKRFIFLCLNMFFDKLISTDVSIDN